MDKIKEQDLLGRGVFIDAPDLLAGNSRFGWTACIMELFVLMMENEEPHEVLNMFIEHMKKIAKVFFPSEEKTFIDNMYSGMAWYREMEIFNFISRQVSDYAKFEQCERLIRDRLFDSH